MAEKKRAIEILLSGEMSPKLTTAFSKAETCIKRYKAMLTGVDGEQRRTGRSAQKAAEGVGGFGKSLLKTAVAFTAAYAGAQSLKDLYSSSVDAAKKAISAHTRLVTLMTNVKGTTTGQIENIGTLSSKYAENTTVSGRMTKLGMSQVATFQLHASSLKKLIPSYLDLAVGSHGMRVEEEQAIQTGNLLGKALTGQAGALKRVGISFTGAQEKILKTGTESQRVATAIQVIQQNYGNLARKMAETPEGRIIRLEKAFGRVRTEIGLKLLPIEEKVVNYVLSHMPMIDAEIKKGTQTVRAWAVQLTPVYNRLVQIGSYVQRNWSWIKPTLKVIIGLYAAWRTAIITLTVAETLLGDARRIGTAVTKGYAIASAAYAAISRASTAALVAERMAMLVYAGTVKSATAAQLLMNLAVSVNPFVALTVAIVAAGAALVVLIKKYREMREAQEKAKQDEKRANDYDKWAANYRAHGNHSIKKQVIAAARAKALAAQHRVKGGAVSTGRLYEVGEHGPELFSPSSPGSIIPHLALAGAGGINVGGITINVSGGNGAQVSSGIKDGTDYLIQSLRRLQGDRLRRFNS